MKEIPRKLILAIYFGVMFFVSNVIEGIYGGEYSIPAPLYSIIVIMAVGFVWLALYFFYTYGKEKKEVKEKEIIDKIAEGKRITDTVTQFIRNQSEFHVDKELILLEVSAFIIIDAIKLNIIMGSFPHDGETPFYKIIPAKHVLEVDAIESDKKYSGGTQTSSTLRSAVTGGILFGGAGAIVGAMAGSQPSANVSLVGIRLSIDDIEVPYVTLNFLADKVARGSETYNKAVANAEEWVGAIRVLQKRAR